MMNKLELINWLTNKEAYLCEVKCKKGDIYTPLKYRGIYEACDSYLEIWNDVGCVEGFIGIYKPVNGGTRMYDINGFSFA